MIDVKENKLTTSPASQTALTTASAEEPTNKKTTGEKFYSVIKFITADVFILAATAALAYVSSYGKESYAGIPNYLKKFQNWLETKLLHNSTIPLSQKGEFGPRIAGAVVSTTILMHGGNAFILPMKWFENNKKKIVGYFNKTFGKQGEEAIGDDRLKHEPKQSWGDIIKGRFSAWALIFTAFMSIDLLGKSESSRMFYLDKFQEKTGRWIAGLTKKGKEFANYHVTQDLPKHLAENKTYRFGKILALDIFATAVSVLTWNFISALSAKKRKKKNIEDLRELQAEITTRDPQEYEISQNITKIKPPAESHAHAVTLQRESMEAQPAQLGI